MDASPEHLRPRFDGGTGVRTGRMSGFDVVRLYPSFYQELISELRFVAQNEDDESNEGTG